MMSLNKKGGKTHTADDGGVSSRKNAAGPFQLSSRAGVSNGNPPHSLRLLTSICPISNL